MISFEQFKEFEFKVGEIKEAKEHPNADKLVILKVDIGEEERQIVAGIRKHYDIDDLVGKKIVIVANLEPAMLRGIKSEGMLLAAVNNDKVVLVTPESDIENGARVQ
ncbi:MAG: methionine--tRNA ligase subunit beta [Candidatus Nanoarchaeia archaeon]|nr:methionine--tRNA ligase subunit beta [Candidatus Nanoarchaeia archaeon]